MSLWRYFLSFIFFYTFVQSCLSIPRVSLNTDTASQGTFLWQRQEEIMHFIVNDFLTPFLHKTQQVIQQM